MPRWIYNRPPETCQENEFRLGQLLNACLPEDWIVRWGFWYEDSHGVLREGDFLVLGPQGGLAVFEVKTSLGYQSHTGQWNTADGDNPLFQLQAQHAGVIRHLQNVAGTRSLPYVAKALVFPVLEIAPNLGEYRGIPRNQIVAANDLRHFTRTWDRLFHRKQPVSGEQRDVFVESFGEGLNPKSVKAFVSETDQLLLQQATASYRLLDMLSGNRQLLVEGGVGTGKSWHAIEQAKRLAENASGSGGRQVLMMTYNIALGHRLRRTVERLGLKRGSIQVETSEALAASIIEACGMPHEVPEDVPGARDYYDRLLPQLALEAISAEPDKLTHLLGRFDALVVDEFQDHDTHLTEPSKDDSTPEPTQGDAGWWSLYASMLKDGWNSPMAIFGDQAQRPPFRPKGRFQLHHLRNMLPQHAHVQLDQVVRYTRPLHEFLLSLEAEGTAALVGGLPRFCPLVDGIDVALHSAGPDEVPAILESILEDWKTQGICSPSKVLLLYDRSHIRKTPLAQTSSLFHHRLIPFADSMEQPGPGTLAHSSIHKAKGLDALAVILLVPRPFESLEDPYDRFTYFMGASRARQVLAVVHYAHGVGPASRHRMG